MIMFVKCPGNGKRIENRSAGSSENRTFEQRSHEKTNAIGEFMSRNDQVWPKVSLSRILATHLEEKNFALVFYILIVFQVRRLIDCRNRLRAC